MTGESGDYAVAEATTTAKGKKGKAKILVGTDVSDNYVMIIGGDEAKYAANEKRSTKSGAASKCGAAAAKFYTK